MRKTAARVLYACRVQAIAKRKCYRVKIISSGYRNIVNRCNKKK